MQISLEDNDFIFGHVLSRTAGWSESSRVLRSPRGTLRSGCASLRSHTQCPRIPFPPPSHQHLLPLDFFDNRQPNRYKLVAHCCFDLHFPGD